MPGVKDTKRRRRVLLPTPHSPLPHARLDFRSVPIFEGFRLALQQLAAHKLRSFFTLLGIIVSVGFLVGVVAVIQGMNAYVRDNLAGAIVGKNAFQIRRTPISIGLIDDEEWRALQRRPPALATFASGSF